MEPPYWSVRLLVLSRRNWSKQVAVRAVHFNTVETGGQRILGSLAEIVDQSGNSSVARHAA